MNEESSRLAGRRVLVTGAGDGLGRATALACARSGATVILLGRTVKKLEAVYDQIEKSGAPAPAIYPLNLAGASWKDYGELAATLDREFGALDGLVHCAAHFRGFAPLADVEAAEWMESLQVNLTAAFSLTRHCLPLLLRAPRAAVVFTGDDSVSEPHAFGGVYGVTKAALEALCATWSKELEATGVRMISFAPGAIRTGVRLRGYPGAAADRVPAPDAAATRIVEMLT